MAIILHQKYEKKIAEVFAQSSFLDGRLSSDYSFTGARTVKVTTPITVPLSDYRRTGSDRYGTPQEMQDTVQELTLSQDKSFAITVDKGNLADQGGIKAAGRMLGLQIKEQVVPLKDRYAFERLAQLGGQVVGVATALTKDNVCDRISAGTLALDNAEVPQDGRTLFLPAEVYKLLKHSDEFLGVEALGERALAKGIVGEYDNMAVVKVPASRLPKHVNFIIVHRSAATAPTKIDDTKLHQDPPGLSGNLMEGRFYYDCFVIGARAKGIYTEVDTASGKGSVLDAPVINASTGAITAAGGAQVKYTTDGSDPRYSSTAVAGTATAAVSGEVISAYAYKADGSAFASPVAKAVKS